MSESGSQTLRYVGVAFKLASELLDTDGLDEVPVGEFESSTREGVTDWARAQVAEGGGRVRVFLVCEELAHFDYGRDWIGTGVTGEVDPGGSVWWSDGYQVAAPVPVRFVFVSLDTDMSADVTGECFAIDLDALADDDREILEEADTWGAYGFGAREIVRRVGVPVAAALESFRAGGRS